MEIATRMAITLNEDVFGDSRYTRDADMAIRIAEALHKELHTCEYGIRIITVNKTWNKIVWESKNINTDEQAHDYKKRFYESQSVIRRVKPKSAPPSSIEYNSTYIPVSERLCLFNDARELYEASHDK